MNFTHFTLPRAQTLLRTGLFAFILAGCGGGVDSGGTGGAATYASGPITGSGSIIVNGVRFDDSTATVSDDDGSTGRSKDDLKLGMVVEVRGSAISTDTAGDKSSTASSISFNSELVGRIDSIDPLVPHQSMVVFGQAVAITSTTVFEDSLVGGSAALAQGNVVEVYALFDAAAGSYTATRVERKSNTLLEFRLLRDSDFRLRGKVSSFDGVTRAFNIGTERISYAAGLNPPAGLADGSIVRVRVNSGGVNHAWTATRLGEGSSRPDDGSQARVEGLISQFTSQSQFTVGTVQVTTGAGTVVSGIPALGVRVEVEGTMGATALAANSVSVEAESGNTENRFVGPISSFNSGAKTFVVKGQTISYAGTPQYQNGSETNLRDGANVDVRATLVNGNQFQATRITFKN